MQFLEHDHSVTLSLLNPRSFVLGCLDLQVIPSKLRRVRLDDPTQWPLLWAPKVPHS